VQKVSYKWYIMTHVM